MNWKIRACAAWATLLVAAEAAALVARPAFRVSAPQRVALVQDGVATVPVTVRGSGFVDGAFRLSGPTNLDLSRSARLHGPGAGRVGFSFENVSGGGGNLTLYVGNEVRPGSYPLTIFASANGVAHAASLVLDVLARGAVYEVWPSRGAGYQGQLPKLKPGDQLVLHQGIWPGPAVIDAGGTAERPVVIRGFGGSEAKPVLEYTGAGGNLWEIHAGNVVVEGLRFVSPATDSIRIRPPAAPAARAVANVSIVANTFVDCGSECVTANDPDTAYRDIRMIDSLVLGARHTAVYVGNQDGSGAFRNFLFERNVIDARAIVAAGEIGYGIEVKPNVENAELRNNYIVGAKGPGIMTYGLKRDRKPAYRNVVEANIVIGSCTDANIDVGAGPAMVRHNVAMGGYGGGFAMSAYHAWPRLSAGIRTYGNTGVLNEPSDFRVAADPRTTGLDDLRMFDNLAYPAEGGTGFADLPAPNRGNKISGNRTVRATAAVAARVGQLRGLIPAPGALLPIWPRLSRGPLDAAQLADLLDALVELPSQDRSNAPRACPMP